MSGNVALLDPKGIVALKERNLIITAILLMLIVVVPVFVLAGVFAWRYRASNKSARFASDSGRHLKIKFLIWTIPTIIVVVLGTITWKTAHELDPFRALESNAKPITIQVVALRWKWLFIYPEQNIATVNFVEFPQNTPVHFELTADAPMNSFWIPQLGGQMYAMAGMTTQLNLMASEAGEFAGSAAEINGKGFAGMRFVAKSTTAQDFDSWVRSVKQTRNTLALADFDKLAEPSQNNPRTFYSSFDQNLFHSVMAKYMPPTALEGWK